MPKAEAGATERNLDPLATFERLREAYFRYYNTPFGLADLTLQEERRRLLDRDGGVFRNPQLELRPEYISSGRTLADSVARAGAAPELAEFAQLGMFAPGMQLYKHQEEALQAGVSPGGHMAITAGTGSGKTESFLLPVLSGLLEESRDWSGSPAPQPAAPWWEGERTPFAAQRDGESGRPQAVRALILYPMNALVDDQLIRLRRALDSDAARLWLDQNRRGHRFYFGRYTGSTPVTGHPGNELVVRDLRRYLRETAQRSQRAAALAGETGRDENTRYFVPRLDGAEMRSRWDMSAAPPDILITNYSMLNVMLLRERDDRFFDATRQWLEDPAHRFTLVVDELHMYRGTAGTEVAYLLRHLKHRLGLSNKPDQFRVLAASASLDADRDAEYLASFFDVDSKSFTFIEGSTRRSASPRPGDAPVASEINAQPTASAAIQVARDSGVVEALRDAFLSPGGSAVTRTSKELASRTFPGAPEADAERALARVLEGIAASPDPRDPKLRAHFFFRNVPGMWACCDPGCPSADQSGGERTVGRLYAEPVTRCDCGSRVLELLYCQNCGEVMLGGFVPEGATQSPMVDTTLLADVPELAKLPDQVTLERTAANYLVYWPSPVASLDRLDRPSWDADGKTVHFAFRRSQLDPAAGALRNGEEDHTGWSFHVTTSAGRKAKVAAEDLSPFPTQCPACGDDWEIRYGKNGALPINDPLRLRSPIRGMRTGFEKINQVLITELAGDLQPRDRKVIVFTDSRQDAAKLSSGLALRHYQDLLRLLLVEQLESAHDPAADVALARAHVVESAKTPDSWAALSRLSARDATAFGALRDAWDGSPGFTAEDALRLEQELSRPPSLEELSGALSSKLLALGVNPGGPHARLQQTQGTASKPWTDLYDWHTSPPRPRAGLSDAHDALRGEIQDSLKRELLEGLFSGAGRDFESLGLGWLALVDDTDPIDVDPASTNAHVRSALRALADQRRFIDLRDNRTDPTARLKSLWKSVEALGGPTVAELGQRVKERAGAAVLDFLIDPSKVCLRPGSGVAWVCSRCKRAHLTRGCAVCTKCGNALPDDAVTLSKHDDYYAWKATNSDGRFRLNCAELTGQTDRLHAQSRQSRFQGVFLDESEQELADGVDLLSVTTTMEAGVDIGSLSTVVLGNMPPTRFNYQQRVGRAGRRGSPVAVALTVCRGRSHDEYYFSRPEKITNEPTPKPYLALNQKAIIARSMRSYVLQLALRPLGRQLVDDPEAEFDLTSNVHGAFGKTAQWATVLRPALASWLASHRDDVRAGAAALTARTPFADESSDLADALCAHLVDEIDAAIPHGVHDDLSQCLAEAGLLPMFGFPSGVRYLHLRRPSRAYPWPPSGTIDRDLAMAVSQFAPLSEIVKDGRVYPVVGVAAFDPVRPKPLPADDALGHKRLLTVCRSCSFLEEHDATEPAAPEEGADSPGEVCPRCGAGPEMFKSMTVREPLGFRAGRARDFDGNFSWTARAMAARAHTDFTQLEQQPVAGSSHVHAGPGRRFVLNDNGGRLFTFAQAHPGGLEWGGYVSTEAVRKYDDVLKDPQSEEFSTALGSVQRTDFLFWGPTAPVRPSAGLRLNLATGERQPSGARDPNEGRRAAWYSLAFLLRTVAAARLDILPLELTAGIYSGMIGAEPALYAFIADSLENGAGFSTHLGTSDLSAFRSSIDAYLTELEKPGHADECNASCYRCLRDYGNMAYHALLDWRLARDLYRLLSGADLQIDEGKEVAALQIWSQSFKASTLDGAPAPTAHFSSPAMGEFAVIVKHPFEASENGVIAQRLADAQSFAEAALPEISGTVFVDTFTIDRDPRRVIEMFDEVDAVE